MASSMSAIGRGLDAVDARATTSDMAPPCFESSRPASSISWETRNNPVALSVPKSAPIVEPTHARMTKTHAKAAARLPERTRRRRRRRRSRRCRSTVLGLAVASSGRREEAARDDAPRAARAVDSERVDGVVDAGEPWPFGGAHVDEIQGPDRAVEDRAPGRHDGAGRRDGHQAREDAVVDVARVDVLLLDVADGRRGEAARRLAERKPSSWRRAPPTGRSRRCRASRRRDSQWKPYQPIQRMRMPRAPNQSVTIIPSQRNSLLSRFSAMTWSRRPNRAEEDPHRHAIAGVASMARSS